MRLHSGKEFYVLLNLTVNENFAIPNKKFKPARGGIYGSPPQKKREGRKFLKIFLEGKCKAIWIEAIYFDQ
jgi:hypothetical protein